MKKILIASACAFTLCLTSCASKKPQEASPQTQAPQVELTEETAAAEETTQEESQETSQADNQTETDNQSETDYHSEESSENTEITEESEAAEEDTKLTSEDFPEAESFDEPEIITLEPVEELPAEEEENTAEQVEQEEPPVIVVKEEDLPTDNFAELPDTAENTEDAVSVTEEENEDDIISVSSDSDEVTAIGNVIDITDDDSDSDEEVSEKETVIIPSRSVTLKKFEYLEVSYPGTGWIYMGLTDNSKDLTYFGRKLGTKDTQFSLQARAAGTKIVHFYRNDPLTGRYLDDYIEVIILPENGSNKTHIQAPEYKLPVQKNEVSDEKTEENQESQEAEEESKSENKTSPVTSVSPSTAAGKNSATAESKNATDAKNLNTTATTGSTASTGSSATTRESNTAENKSSEVSKTEDTVTNVQTVTDSSSLLKEAQLLYNEKEYSAALNKLNQFFEYSTDNRDEALYLKGQILEAKSDIRDIKGAMDAYTSLTKNYPASKLWDSANKRIIYLKRFYLEVR